MQKLRDISDFYSDKLSDSSFIDNSGQSLSKMVKKVFNKRLKAGQIDKKVFDYNYKKLIDAAEKGGLNLNVKYGAPDWEYAQTLKNNLATFAAFKQHNEVSTLVSLLTDKEGKPRSWKAFRDDALKVSKKYNVNWLRSEFNRAQSSARAAVNWKRYEQRSKLYPNLRYIATNDERTRHSHAQLHGAVYPIDHSFWNEYYPPNDWGCRCRVEQTDEPADQKQGYSLNKDFANNVGKTGRVFQPEHPYVQQTSNSSKAAIKTFILSKINTPEAVRKAKSKFDKYDVNYKKAYFDYNTGGFNVYHKNHQFDKRFGKYEKKGGKILANRGKQIEFLDETGANTSADLKFDGKIWEFKTVLTNSSGAVKGRLRDSIKQADRVIIYFKEFPGESLFKKGLSRFIGELKAHNKINHPSVYLLHEDGRLVKYLDKKKG